MPTGGYPHSVASKPPALSLRSCFCLAQVLSFPPVSQWGPARLVDSPCPGSVLLLCVGRIMALPQSFHNTCPLPSFYVALDLLISHLDLESNFVIASPTATVVSAQGTHTKCTAPQCKAS